jgi:hypothetical protein
MMAHAQKGCPRCGSMDREVTSVGTVFCSGCGEQTAKEWMPAFSYLDTIFLSAVALGCTPLWTGYRWECRCRPHPIHGVNTSYPAMTMESIERARMTA